MNADMGSRRAAWRQYVQYVTRGATQKEVADVVGVNQTTISNWRGVTQKAVDPKRIENGHLANLAVGFGRNPLEAMVAAGQLPFEAAEPTLRNEPDSIRLLSEIGLVPSDYPGAQSGDLTESG